MKAQTAWVPQQKTLLGHNRVDKLQAKRKKRRPGIAAGGSRHSCNAWYCETSRWVCNGSVIPVPGGQGVCHYIQPISKPLLSLCDVKQ